MKPETKVGFFAVIGVVLFGISVYMLGNLSVGGNYKILVKFSDVSGLPNKSVIKLNGVEVGKVRNIKMDGEGVLVTLGVKKNFVIYKDAGFKIASTSLIGSKYLGVEQGHASAGQLRDGDIVVGINEPSMERMISDTLASVNDFVQTMNNDGNFGKDLNATLSNMRTLSSNLNELIASLRPYLESSMEDISDVTVNLKDLMARADEITRQIQDSEGVLGALINDPEMKQDFKESITNFKSTMNDAKEFVGKVSRFRIFWLFDGYYNTDSNAFSSNIGLKIYPSNNYLYYRVGLSNLGNKDDSTGSKDYLERNVFDARLGLYNDYFDVSAGFIMGAGGIALKVTPLPHAEFWRRVSVDGQFTDFGRDRVINGRTFDKPNVWYGANFEINKYFSVGGGIMDAMEVNQPYLKMSIQFQDKDIASFFGLATLAS